MSFAHDPPSALVAAAALVSTVTGVRDRLDSPAALDHFLDAHAVSGRRDGTTEELRAVRAPREQLRRMWGAHDPKALALQVNALLSRTGGRPRLVRHDGWSWHLHATQPHAALVDRLAAEAALVDVERGQDLRHLRGTGPPRRAGGPLPLLASLLRPGQLLQPHARHGLPRPAALPHR